MSGMSSARDAVDDTGSAFGYAISDLVKLKRHPATAGGSFDGSSSSRSVNQVKENSSPWLGNSDFEIKLYYLKMRFSEKTDQSLRLVLMANDGDFDAAVTMLQQLEFVFLPDSLGPGDVSEPAPSAVDTLVPL